MFMLAKHLLRKNFTLKLQMCLAETMPEEGGESLLASKSLIYGRL